MTRLYSVNVRKDDGSWRRSARFPHLYEADEAILAAEIAYRNGSETIVVKIVEEQVSTCPSCGRPEE